MFSFLLEVYQFYQGFPYGSVGKESACSAGDLGSIPGLERSPGEGKGYLLGATTGDPTHDKVMWKRSDEQGRSELKGPPGTARASAPKPKSVYCLLYYAFHQLF